MIKEFIEDNAPEILIGIGLLGIVATGVLAAKATPKAQKHLNEALDKKINETDNVEAELTLVEKAKAVAVDVAIPAGAAIGAGACFLYAYSKQAEKISLLTLAYNGVVFALEDKQKLNDKFKEALGEKKAEKIREEHDIERAKVTYGNLGSVAWERSAFSKGDVPIIDLVSGAKFLADRNTVDAAFNRFNIRMQDEMEMNMYDLLYEMGVIEHANKFDLANSLYWDSSSTRSLVPRWGTMDCLELARPVYTISYDYPTKIIA